MISEMIPGIPGDNNFEFIELYNAGTEAVNLKGWTLWYKMLDDNDEERVALWTARADVPGYGHYLLVRAGEDVGAVPDAVFNVPLFERKGGLVLRDAEGTIVDTLGWGDAPTSFVNDTPVPAPTDGASLERVPGGAAGNGADTDNSGNDFMMQGQPDPQNRGDSITPLTEKNLRITASAPGSIQPGTEFTLNVEVSNHTGTAINLGTVVVPVPADFEVLGTPADAIIEDNLIKIAFSRLPEATTQVWAISLRSPWNYGTVHVGGLYVETPDWPLRAYNMLVPITIEGGAIPIATARTLVGKTVTIEGVATMYTGGFYAGSTGTKFYLEDETGGIQVYCPGAVDIISARIGDRARVTGKIEVYRDSLEIIPVTYPNDVEILEKGEPLPARPTSGQAANSDPDILGRLIQVEGKLTRLEEFSYSYEADLLDDEGYTTLIYIDKESKINPEFLEVGKRYHVAGISELYSTQWQLKPRTSADFVEVFPPELMLEITAQNSVAAGGIITYTLVAHNHTEAFLTNVHITAGLPGNASLVAIQDEGSLTGTAVVWTLPELAGNGGSATVHYAVRAGSTGRVEVSPATAVADQWPEPAATGNWMTFVGSGVPIWAIQGTGAASPFVRSEATTEGLVTGVFPKQGGVWVQSTEPDNDPATSEGIFVLTDWDPNTPPENLPVAIGDHVLVTGRVREKSGQTLLHLSVPESGVQTETLRVVGSYNMLPEPVELDPPQDEAESKSYYEALEGMLVSVNYPVLAVAPTSKYGEYVLVHPRWEITRVYKGDPKGMFIFVDDGSDETHLDQSTLPYVVQTGDMVGDIVGPLAYTYDNYKIQPILTPTVITSGSVLSSLPLIEGNELSIATFNTENFFDIVDPHPSDPPKPKPDEYRLKLTKTADTIARMGAPDIIGFQEIENVGILEDLAGEPALTDFGYIPVLLEGFDSRGIDVGYLVRGDRATLEGVSQHDAPEGLTSRPPLLITATVHLPNGDQTIYVFNNHFLSMSEGEAATEPRRDAQAAWNVTLVEALLHQHPDAFIVVLGDLNSFYQSRPIDTLRNGGLRHVYEFAEPERLYTYIYQGESETLDHILVTPNLYNHLTRVIPVHLNADYPPAPPEDTSARRSADHDPLVAVFSFE